MFARDLHLALAMLTALALLVATVEGAIRAVNGKPAGSAAMRTRQAAALSVLMTAAAGLALLVGGRQPQEWLHLMYALFALGLLPVADSWAVGLKSLRGQGLARFGATATTMVVLMRLFATG